LIVRCDVSRDITVVTIDGRSQLESVKSVIF